MASAYLKCTNTSRIPEILELPFKLGLPVLLCMAQVKVFALRETLEAKGEVLSDAIHDSLVQAIGLPKEKRFQRFIPLEKKYFQFPADRSSQYTIIEISMFIGRTRDTKKNLIRALYRNIGIQAGIEKQNVEVTIFESPKENWGIRGLPGDELELDYTVEQ